MELFDDVLEDWPGSLDLFGSVWMEALGGTGSGAGENWSVCLTLMEHLCLDLLGQLEVLLEHRAVCFNLLGSLYADDPLLWMFIHN